MNLEMDRIKRILIISFIFLYIVSFASVGLVDSSSSEDIISTSTKTDDALEVELKGGKINNIDNKNKSLTNNKVNTASDLVSHSSIYVNGNDNFRFKAEREGWNGDGSEDNPFIIENYDIDARGAGNAIMISNTDLHFVVRNCIVYNAAWLSNPYLAGEGIAMYNASNGLIENNTAFSNDGDGIDLQIANNVIIRNNEVLSNYDDGIHLTDARNIIIENNTVSTNNDDGIYMDGGCVQNIIKDNLINLNGKYSISISYSNDNIISNNTLIKSKAGILSSQCIDITLNENRIEDATYGIYFLATNKSVINRNEVSRGDYGIYVSSVSESKITNNSVISAEYSGISLTISSKNNLLDNNTVSSNDQNGMYISSSGDNEIYNNTIYSNNWVGLLITMSNNNMIRYNNITSNSIGVEIKESNRNLIYNNNFINNRQQVSAEKKNKWDNGYPIGGNYWSNYLGEDLMKGPEQDQEGSDGIGDSPHKIYFDINVDHYPLMRPIKSSSQIKSPTSPQNFEIQSGDGYVALDWEVPESNGGSPIIDYKIYRGKDIENISFYTSARNIETSYIDSQVENNVTYYYYIAAVNSIGEGNKTNTLSAKPEKEIIPPSNPQNLTAEYDGEDSVILRWDPPSGDISVTDYHIYRGETSDKKVNIDNVSGRTFRYIDKNLDRNVTYYYQISAMNSAGESNRSNEVVVNIEPEFFPPTRPRDLSIQEGNNNLTINWSPPEETGGRKIIGYKIYRSESGVGTKHIATVMNKEIYVDKNVTNYQLYNYRVSAYNVVGESELSEAISGKASFQGDVGGNKGDFYQSNWFIIPLFTILAMLIIAKLFVIRPLIKAQR